MYQDVHTMEGTLPEVVLDRVEDGGECNFFIQRGCWEVICHAILEAHHLVYIVGYLIYDKVKQRELSMFLSDE